MPTPFDATTKSLLERDPLAWVRLLGLEGDDADLIDADVATITALADRVIRVNLPQPYLVHIEFQASYDPEMGRRLLRYNVLLNYRHNQPVRSFVILLRPSASGPKLTGVTQLLQPDKTPYLEFRYGVFRIWEQPTELLLGGPTALAPLAVLGQLTQAELPALSQRLWEQISTAVQGDPGELWTAAFILAGLRFPANLIESALRRNPDMKESVTYQLLVSEGRAEGRLLGIAEGKIEGKAEGIAVGKTEGIAVGKTEGEAAEARKLLRLLGDKRFGPPSDATLRQLALETDPARLEAWAMRLLEATSWNDLLAEPQ